MSATKSTEDESTRLRRENTEKLAKSAEQVELALNRELAKKHGVTSNRVTLVHAVSARLRAMLGQARIGEAKKETGGDMKRLPNGFINDPPTWLLAHSTEGWALRGWPSAHPLLPTNKAISAWPTATLYSILAMLLNGTILLVLPSPTQPDMETIIRAPRDVEPPAKRARRSGSVGADSRAGSVWGSEYGGSDTEELEVLGMLAPTRDDAAPSPSASTVPTDAHSATIPPASPRADDDTTLAPSSTSPSSSKVKAKPRKSAMKARPSAGRAKGARIVLADEDDGEESETVSMKASRAKGPRIVLADEDDGEESEAVSSSAASSSEDEAESTPEPEAAASASKKHKRSASSATAADADAPPAKKHRRSRSGLDPEERARLLEQKEAAKAARKAQKEVEREAKREAKEAERKARIEQRILKEARKEAEELARMERDRRGVEEVKETKRRMSVAPSEVDVEERESKRRKVK